MAKNQDQQAVVDRFEGDLAVLLVGEHETELVVPQGSLPKDVTEGAWLRVQLKAGKLMRAALDPEATRQAQARVEEKMRELRGRGGSGP